MGERGHGSKHSLSLLLPGYVWCCVASGIIEYLWWHDANEGRHDTIHSVVWRGNEVWVGAHIEQSRSS